MQIRPLEAYNRIMISHLTEDGIILGLRFPPGSRVCYYDSRISNNSRGIVIAMSGTTCTVLWSQAPNGFTDLSEVPMDDLAPIGRNITVDDIHGSGSNA